MSEIVLVSLPFGIHKGTLVSFPNTREPVACRSSLQNAELTDHSGETATGEAATGETKEEQLIVRAVVIDEEAVGGKNVFVDASAEGSC